MKQMRFLLILAILLAATLACNLSGPPTPTPEPPAHPVVPDAPAAPADPAAPPDPTITQSAAPPTVPAITPTDTPLPAAPSSLLPAGFLSAAGDQKSVTVYNLQGQSLAVMRTPGMSAGNPNSVHFAGRLPGDAYSVPVVFVNIENQGRILQNLGDQMTELFPGPDASHLSGAPGSNIFAFTANSRTGDGSSVSQLHVYNPAAGVTQVHTWQDANSTVIFPLAVKAAGNAPQSIWYTHQLWGIGGDIVFPPQVGLFRLDLPGQQETLLLAADFTPVGLSPDQTWTAYVPKDQGYASSAPQITFDSLTSGKMLQFSLEAGSDRGAGYAVFSPDNRYAAWMEGAGWQMAEIPNFTSLVRIVALDGNMLASLPVGAFASAAGIVNPAWAKPVGWLDTETLIVEIRGEDWNNPALVRVRFDGSGIAYLAAGNFAGFVYP